MRFQQIRGATVRIAFGGLTFLVDPFFAPRGTTPPVPSAPNSSPNPLVELPLPVADIIRADAVIVTHMHHFDHFDAAARDALPRDIPLFTQNEEEARDMRALGFCRVTALPASTAQGLPFGPVTLFRTEAAHGLGEKVARFYQSRGVPAQASGVAFAHADEKTLYLAGDTVWFAGVREAIHRHRPGVIVLNAAEAAFADDAPILMGLDGLRAVTEAAPQATVIASHLDAVNHARLDRAAVRRFVAKNHLAARVLVPEDGETLNL